MTEEDNSSKAITLADAKKKDPSIMKEDVEMFYRKNVEMKKNQEGIILLSLHPIIILISWTYSLFPGMILKQRKSSGQG